MNYQIPAPFLNRLILLGLTLFLVIILCIGFSHQSLSNDNEETASKIRTLKALKASDAIAEAEYNRLLMELLD